jgi:hypothetical protein
LFLVPALRETKKITEFQRYKEKIRVETNFGTKIVNHDIKGFHLVKEVPFRCVFTLKLSKKTRSKLGNIFYFGMISGFCIVF